MFDFLAQLLMPQRSMFQLLSGQAYFVLGMVLARQTWRASQLPLARNLTWLSGFGFGMAAFEWLLHLAGMAGGANRPAGAPLALLAAAALGVAYAHLHQFGARSLMQASAPAGRWAARLGPGSLILWIVWVVGPGWTTAADTDAWLRTTITLASLGLGLPAALLSAYGLRQHARSMVAPLAIPSVLSSLRSAGLSLIGFAFLACLIVPATSFLPAGWPVVEAVESTTGLPIELLRGLIGLALAVTMSRAMSVFQTEFDRRLRELEEQQILLSERERLGRELHDVTLQSIYAAGLLLHSAEPELPRDGLVAQRIGESLQLLNGAVDDIRGYIGALKPRRRMTSLSLALRKLAASRLLNSIAAVDLDIDLPDDLSLDASMGHHVLAIVNEALSNVARHSAAERVRVSAALKPGWLELELQDDGRGLPERMDAGHGLRNMCERARILGGSCTIESPSAGGTRVSIRVPLNAEESV